MKKILATGRKLSFGELYQGVLRGGPATKFAVRSALGKARQKGTIKFDGEQYFMAPAGGKRVEKTEAPRVVRRRAQKSPGPSEGSEAAAQAKPSEDIEITFSEP